MQHGGRYDVRIRGGLPAADGEMLAQPSEIDVYVRDRAPWVGFAGNSYVLPAGPGASLPIVSVNTDKASAQIYRINDRSVAFAIRNNQFLRTLASWSAGNIGEETGELVWEGEILIQSELNQTITTAIPVTDAVPEMKPGVYVITARAELDPDEWGQLATQWFVVSDLGLTALSGSDGIHAIVRSLSTAEPVAGAKLRLVAVNNDVLGEATTDANGYVRFDPGLARGTGGTAPQMIDATLADGDYGFLDLRRSAFDLSDRGVEGRPAPGPLDVFVTPERGIYRPGETVHLTALVRDARAVAVSDLPLTLVVERPDGVEYLRETLSDGGLGGYSANVPLEAEAMRGSWQVRLYADPKGSSDRRDLGPGRGLRARAARLRDRDRRQGDRHDHAGDHRPHRPLSLRRHRPRPRRSTATSTSARPRRSPASTAIIFGLAEEHDRADPRADRPRRRHRRGRQGDARGRPAATAGRPRGRSRRRSSSASPTPTAARSSAG